MPKKTKVEEPAAAPLDQLHYFATPIYITKQPQFIEIMREVSLESLKKVHGRKKPDKLYPVRMSDNLLLDPRVTEFAEFIGSTGWNILSSQGYDMRNFNTTFTELWCQEHYYGSSMEHHVHPGGNYLVGFYFLDTPEGSPRAIIHDPRPARMMLELPQADQSQATLASTMINFTPEPGMVMFAPAWLGHSFMRHASKEPFRFIHFNLAVQPASSTVAASSAEVI